MQFFTVDGEDQFKIITFDITLNFQRIFCYKNYNKITVMKLQRMNKLFDTP